MTVRVHREWFVLPEHSLSHVELNVPCHCSCCAKLPPKSDRNEKKIPYFVIEVAPPLYAALRSLVSAFQTWFGLF